ncbi:MAG: glutathione ABC transporter permease GsiC, partial [Gammaproteobacteria bacterium]|nr:glutathione ABC transporter permease GsiC [Gammaproteobacteria bacterium]
MSSYLLQRLSGACLVVLGVVSIVFLLLHLVPGDPVEIMLGESASAGDRLVLRSALG